MKISFCPQRSDRSLSVTKSGDVLTINDDPFDFSTLPDGATIPDGEIPCDWFVGPVERVDGELRLTLLLPYGPNPEPWQEFPDPIENAPDGPLDIPSDTRTDIAEEKVEGGTNLTITTYRWRQQPEVNVAFLPDPVGPDAPQEQEASDVEA